MDWVPLGDRPPEERIALLEQRVKRLEAHASLMSVGNVHALIRQTVEPAIGTSLPDWPEE